MYRIKDPKVSLEFYTGKAYKVQYGLGFQKYYLFTAYIFTKKQAKYVLQKNEYSLVLENKYGSPKTMTKVWGILIFGLP